LYISFPKNYSTKDTITYPVLYVLDGEFNSSFVKGMRKQFQFENEIEDVIIVGIGSGLDFLSWYSNRYNNYTTTVSIAEDEKRKKKKNGKLKGTYKYGGAAKFLESIKTEITPIPK